MKESEERKDEILRKGSVEAVVIVSGVRQRHLLEVKREDTPFGRVPFLVSRHYIPKNEMVRLAEELGLPVKSKEATVLPPGKLLKDFAGS